MKYIAQKDELLKVLKEFNLCGVLKECRAVIAGGSITSVFTKAPIKDYDIYCKSIKDAELLRFKLKEKGFFNKITTDNAYTLLKNDKKKNHGRTLTIQIIRNEKFCNENIQDVFKYFDFTCCMGAYDFEEDIFKFHDRFFIDNMSKQLVFNPGTEFPICSLYRTKKYQRKGYNLSGKEIIKLALTINQLEINTYADLKRQLNGIDTMYLSSLTEKLMKIDGECDKTEFLDFFCQWADGEGISDKLAEKYLDNEDVEVSEDDDEYSLEDIENLYED